ncbi:MAG: hypothetical protein Q7R65_02615, partial [bacterium]|nr:hypothetical protein [bacterium]
MRNTQKGFTPVILLILIVLLLGLGYAGYKFYQKSEPVVSDSTKDQLTYKNDEYGFSFQYPAKYALTPGADRYLVSFIYHNPAKNTDTDDAIHVTAFIGSGAPSFKDYLAKNPVLHPESGQPIPYDKFTSVTLGGKVFYYIVGERFEGIFSTEYYYVTPSKIYLFQSISYIGADWTDPNFD